LQVSPLSVKLNDRQSGGKVRLCWFWEYNQLKNNEAGTSFPAFRTRLSIKMLAKQARVLILVFILAAALVSAGSGMAQSAEDSAVKLSSPLNGEALQGVVAVRGSSEAAGFRVAEIAFAYQSDPTGTWFLIQQSSTPVSDGALASWDTTTITDGVYKLRIQVFLEDGRVLESTVSGLRVRNYTPIETSTPAATVTGPEQPTQTPSPLPDYQAKPVTPVPLPTNPAQLAQVHLQRSALQGAGLVLILALLAGIYIGFRSLFRR
jgi:hypothetical protein